MVSRLGSIYGFIGRHNAGNLELEHNKKKQPKWWKNIMHTIYYNKKLHIHTHRKTSVSIVTHTLMPVPLSWIISSLRPPSRTVNCMFVAMASKLHNKTSQHGNVIWSFDTLVTMNLIKARLWPKVMITVHVKVFPRHKWEFLSQTRLSFGKIQTTANIVDLC